MNLKLNLNGDYIDFRDILARFEELEGILSDAHCAKEDVDEDDKEEYDQLQAIIEDLKGYGGDEQWRGDWYPVSLIKDDYFEEFAQQDLEDCGMIPRDLPSFIAIDWTETADNMKQDYSSVEIDGTTYYYR